jgi:hypothetical protein
MRGNMARVPFPTIPLHHESLRCGSGCEGLWRFGHIGASCSGRAVGDDTNSGAVLNGAVLPKEQTTLPLG